jgi:hypothetical protein
VRFSIQVRIFRHAALEGGVVLVAAALEHVHTVLGHVRHEGQHALGRVLAVGVEADDVLRVGLLHAAAQAVAHGGAVAPVGLARDQADLGPVLGQLLHHRVGVVLASVVDHEDALERVPELRGDAFEDPGQGPGGVVGRDEDGHAAHENLRSVVCLVLCQTRAYEDILGLHVRRAPSTSQGSI